MEDLDHALTEEETVETCGELTDDDIVQLVTDAHNPPEDTEQPMDEVPIPPPTFAEALKMVGKLEYFASSSDSPNGDMMHATILRYQTLMMDLIPRQ